MRASITAFGLAATLLTGCGPGGHGDHPPVFDTRSYAEAKAAAEADHRWFIVKGTAVWCPPCKAMDKTTWRDESVVAWFRQNGIAVALDVDLEPQIAKKLDISGIPVMIAFKDGVEIDRIVGMREPADFLAWLNGLDK
jgi:thioredoxin-like negative regulator of GroEL